MPITRITRRDFLAATCRRAFVVGMGSLAAFPTAALAAQVDLAAQRARSSRRFFSFLHSYEATGRYWHGLAKTGLLRPTTGVRLVNSPWGDDSRRFNTVARRNGELHGILKQRRCPFIVDRVVGGSIFLDYDFDDRLIKHYTAMLGDKFLGGQVHEPISNVHNDWKRIVTANPKFKEDPVLADELRDYFAAENATHWLDYGTVDDFAGRPCPKDEPQFWREITRAVRRQAARFGSRFSYCEGSKHGELVWHAFYKLGARYGLAEVGPWASQQSQFAIASLRGAARAAGKPWGVFFAPWGPRGCTSFVPESDWSWQCPKKFFDALNWPVDANSGPSTALQRRIFFHTYLSGAWTLHEEWGAEGNLTHWESARLSSNGRVTRDFLDFQEQHPDMGEPYTPLALALDPHMPARDAEIWANLKAALFQPDATGHAYAARKTSHSLETGCYAPCVIPEVFDIVPADAPHQVWNNYREVIKVGSTKFSPDQVVALARELSPFELKAHLPMQINRRQRDGAWIVGLYNPWGAKRGDVEQIGSILDTGCAVRAVLRPKFRMSAIRVLHGWPGGSTASQHGGEIEATIGAGGTLVLAVMPTVTTRRGPWPGL